MGTGIARILITPDTDKIAECCECGESLEIKETGTPMWCLDCRAILRDKEAI